MTWIFLQLLMHPSHVQFKICKSECLQDIMHRNRINKSELKLYQINKIQEFITSCHAFKASILTQISSKNMDIYIYIKISMINTKDESIVKSITYTVLSIIYINIHQKVLTQGMRKEVSKRMNEKAKCISLNWLARDNSMCQGD